MTAVEPVVRFEFATATRIIFGAGASEQLPALLRDLGRRAFLVTGANPRRRSALLAAIGAATDHPLEQLAIRGEPSVALVEEAAQRARTAACDVVVAIGGGSAIDAAKAIAALVSNDAPALEYLEVVGRGRVLERPPLPFIAVPTTAGTGAEVTRNAVLSVPSARVKVSLRSPLMLPRIALIDPLLTLDLPAEVTAATGMDALTQVIEPFLSSRANPLTDALCRDGMARAARALPVVVRDPRNVSARIDMSLASLYGGLALANAGLGAVHGFASPIGGEFAAPHGAVCATLLPHVLEANERALRHRNSPDARSVLARFDEVARLLTGNPSASAPDAITFCRELVRSLEIPALQRWGIRAEHISELASKAANASSMKGNPVPLTDRELRSILENALV